MTDKEFDTCMALIVQGEKDALKTIYDEYVKYIFSIVYQMVQSKENAEDITSEFFIKLWTGAEKYSPGKGHKGYLATIARNMTIDFLRKSGRELLVSEFESEGKDEDNTGGSLSLENQKIIQNENQQKNVEDIVTEKLDMAKALEKLKPSEREVINLKIMSDMTFQEIADILKKPLGTITWWYKEAIDKLRRCGYEQ